MFYLKKFQASVILEKIYFFFFNSVTIVNKKSPVLRRDKMFLSILIMGVVYSHALHFVHYICHWHVYDMPTEAESFYMLLPIQTAHTRNHDMT